MISSITKPHWKYAITPPPPFTKRNLNSTSWNIYLGHLYKIWTSDMVCSYSTGNWNGNVNVCEVGLYMKRLQLKFSVWAVQHLPPSWSASHFELELKEKKRSYEHRQLLERCFILLTYISTSYTVWLIQIRTINLGHVNLRPSCVLTYRKETYRKFYLDHVTNKGKAIYLQNIPHGHSERG